MKKSCFFLGTIFLILLLPLCTASVEKFNDWVYDSDTLVIDEQTFNFKISQNSNNIMVSYGSESKIINMQSCKDDGKIKICLDAVSIDNFNKDNSAHIIISYFEPNFSIIRTVNKEEAYVGDYITFNLKVTNIGDLEARNMVYTDYFPSEILIDKVDGKCQKGDGNKIIYAANLKASDSFSCTYTVIPSKESEQKLKAQIDYESGFSTKKVFSDITTIKSKPLYSITAYQEKNEGNISNRTKSYTEINKAKIQVGEAYNLFINLSNIFPDDLTFQNLTITFPNEMRIDKSDMVQNKNIFLWSGTLEKNSTKSFYLTITPLEGGNFEIIYDAAILRNNNILNGLSYKNNFEILSGTLEILSNLDNITSFDATKEMYLTFSGKNTNNYTIISSGFVNITSDFLPPIRVPITKITPKDSVLIYQISTLPKNVSSSITKKITLDLDYITEYGVRKTEKKEWDITIKPIKDIEITKTLSKTSITEGDDVLVYVKIKNTRSRPIYNIHLEELIPEGISRNGRTRASIDTLLPDETASVYNYTIKAPKVKNESKFLIKTSLSYFEELNQAEIKTQDTINVSNELNITISPKKIDLSIKKSGEYSTINLGESVKIVYTIENEDTETAYNLDFVFSKDKYSDLLNEYDYKIDRLEPGEIMTFKRETVKPKKHGTYNIGETMVYFYDIDKNLFNYSISTLSLTIQNRSIKWPSIILTKTLSTARIAEGEALNITLSAENLGDEGVNLVLKDQNKETSLYAPAKTTKNFTYQITPKYKETLTEAYAFYNYQGNEHRAYAKAPLLTVTEKSYIKTDEVKTIILNNTIQEINNTIQENITNSDISNQSAGKKLLSSIWTKIKSMFGF